MTKARRLRIEVAVISHRHGTDVIAAAGRRALYQKIYDLYVRRYWHECCGDIELPKNARKAVKTYFEAAAVSNSDCMDLRFDSIIVTEQQWRRARET